MHEKASTNLKESRRKRIQKCVRLKVKAEAKAGKGALVIGPDLQPREFYASIMLLSMTLTNYTTPWLEAKATGQPAIPPPPDQTSPTLIDPGMQM
jgi:hypothetical protein